MPTMQADERRFNYETRIETMIVYLKFVLGYVLLR